MESSAAPSSTTPAPYGRACAVCAHAKAKCVYQDGITKCGRCYRLNKECQPSPSVRGSGIKKKTSTKTARLEEKLDGLVSLLTTASKPHAGQSPTPGQLNTSAALAQFGASPESLESRAASPGHEAAGVSDNGVSQDSDRQYMICSQVNNVYFPGIRDYAGDNHDWKASTSGPPYQISAFYTDEADESLELFKTQMLRYFPFMVLPESITPQELRSKSPFLWLCIMAFTTKSSERRRILGLEIRQTIGTKMIAEGQRSKDFIHGLLLYANWGHYYIFAAPIMTHVLHLAVGMLGDIGLKKPPPKDSPCMMLNYDARGFPKPFLPESRTLDDRRLAISCWSASQFVSSFFQKVDTMRWLPYYDECLRLLTGSHHSADTFLVQLVRLQLVHEKVIHAPWHDLNNPVQREYQPGDHATEAAKITPSAPASFYVKALQNDLNQAREQIPSELRQNEILALYGYNVEVCIHEIALSKALDPGFQRLESLWAALQAIKSWYELFFRFSPATYVGVSMGVYAQFAHCLVALSRLSSFEHPDWDLKLARETCNLSTILDQIIDRFARVKVEANLDCSNREDIDVFSSNSRRVTAIKQWWNAKLAAEQSTSTETAASASDQVDENIAADPMLTGPPIDFSDDSWLRDILSLDDNQFSQFLQ